VQRKVVTIVFSDVVGSTFLGERPDPEHVGDPLA
jgi:class 3 adenylate cyclase